MMQKVKSKLLAVSSAIFAAIISVIVLCVLFRDGGEFSVNQNCPFLTIVFGIIITALILRFRKPIISRLEKVSVFHERIIVACMMLLMVFMIVLVVWALRVHPSWDPGIIQNNVSRMLNGERPTGYFNSYPFQLAILVLLYVPVRVVRLFFGAVSINQVALTLNTLFIIATIVFTFLSIRKMLGRGYGLVAIILMPIIMLPLILYMPIFYTDTISAAAVAISLYLIISIIKDNKHPILYSVLLGLVTFFGYRIKATMAIIVIAFGIVLFLTAKRSVLVKERIVPIVLFAVIILVGNVAWGVLYNKYVDTERVIPMEHWVLMGMTGHGGFNEDGFGGEYRGANTNKEIKQVARELISERLSGYGPVGYMEFLSRKISFTWGDGSYFVSEKLGRQPVNETEIGDYVYGDKKGLFLFLMNVIKITSLLLMLVGAWQTLKENNDRLLAVMKIAFCGVFLFFCLWETRSRYLLNYLPMFIAMDFYFITKISLGFKYIDKKRAKMGTKKPRF